MRQRKRVRDRIRVLVLLNPPNYESEAMVAAVEGIPGVELAGTPRSLKDAVAMVHVKPIDVVVLPSADVDTVHECRQLLLESTIRGMVLITGDGQVSFAHYRSGVFERASITQLGPAIRAACGGASAPDDDMQTARPGMH
jgi:hypothetical protein